MAVSRAASPERLRELCERAARAGLAVAQGAFGGRQAFRRKHDRSEVTEYDLAAEHAIVALLHAADLDAVFLTEEETERRTTPAPGQVCWVVDPIDGTRNFVRGTPLFASSVAALIDGAPVAGAIATAHNGSTLSADGRAAYCDGIELVTPAAPPSAAGESGRLLAAIPSMRSPRNRALVDRLLRDLVIRNYGSTAVHLAMVATGELDAALHTSCKLWDIAAGWLIVTRAGGVMTTPTGAPLFPLSPNADTTRSMPSLASGGGCHRQLLGAIEGASD